MASHVLLPIIANIGALLTRQSVYVYSSAKAGFTAFLSELRNRLAKKGVHKRTVKPGFVRTRMTEHMRLPRVLTAKPHEVGEAIFDAVVKGKNVI
jgi:decaprenylphospho-beta-D-erythro-pentofuranosid-2-ulose 2-reductase